MSNAIQNPPTTTVAQAPKPRVARRKTAPNFQQTLDRALKTNPTQTPGVNRPKQVASRPAQPAKSRTSPEEAANALSQAMARENVPDSWRPGLDFIMRKESSGQIGIRNPVHSARGLFQLTRVNYHLNPNGEASFGNGVEEAQGGIRYIKQRYKTIERAVAHWNQKGWY
jgi:hypothetical protein